MQGPERRCVAARAGYTGPGVAQSSGKIVDCAAADGGTGPQSACSVEEPLLHPGGERLPSGTWTCVVAGAGSPGSRVVASIDVYFCRFAHGSRSQNMMPWAQRILGAVAGAVVSTYQADAWI